MTNSRRDRIRSSSSPLGLTRSRSQGGFTLVEILVALALLLIGIYAALRIFPTGFAYQQFSQDRVRANNLARAEIERVKLSRGSLPDAIIVTDPFGEMVDDAYLGAIGGYDPYDRTPRVQAATGALVTSPGWEPDGAYLQRLIIGETVTIPPLGGAASGVVPIHLLNFAPIDYLHYRSDGVPTGDPIQVRSTLYQSVSDLNLLADLPPGSHHYYLDYPRAEIYFRVGELPRRVAIDYTYIGSDGRAYDVLLANPIQVPTSPAPGRLWTPAIRLSDLLPPTGYPGISRVVRGTVQVYEVFEYVAGGAPAGLQSNQFSLELYPDIALGRINFSPSDAGRTVKIDYRVKDWGIVREDRRLESGSRVILAVQDIAADDSYASQPREANPVVGNAYIVAVGLSDGTVYYPDTDFSVDSRHGVLTFHTLPVGTEVRVFYRSLNHWTVQVMKPAAVYRRHAAIGGDAWPGFQSFLWGGGNNGAGRQLYFSPQYAGMMVTVDYQRAYDCRWIIGELHQITPVAGNRRGEEVPAGVPPGLCGLWRDQRGGQSGLRQEPLADSFITVRGASVRTRTLWAERGRADTLNSVLDANPSEMSGRLLAEVWREVNLDTHLTKVGDWGAMP